MKTVIEETFSVFISFPRSPYSPRAPRRGPRALAILAQAHTCLTEHEDSIQSYILFVIYEKNQALDCL